MRSPPHLHKAADGEELRSLVPYQFWLNFNQSRDLGTIQSPPARLLTSTPLTSVTSLLGEILIVQGVRDVLTR